MSPFHSCDLFSAQVGDDGLDENETVTPIIYEDKDDESDEGEESGDAMETNEDSEELEGFSGLSDIEGSEGMSDWLLMIKGWVSRSLKKRFWA